MASNSYFSHDSNARNSKKMLRMRQKLGPDIAPAAYGVYWMLVERLREEEGYECEKDYDMLAFDFRVDKELIRSVVEDFHLFEFSSDGKRFSSHGLDERMETAEQKSKAGKKGAESRWRNGDKNGHRMAQNGTPMADHMAESQQSDSRPDGINKIKEIKEIKENYSSSFPSSFAEASEEERQQEEQEQIVFDFTFNKNWASPNKEYEKLMAFNNRPDAKKKWSDMSPVEKQSALTMWQQKPEKPARFSKEFLAVWRSVYDTLVEMKASRRVRMAALADEVTWSRENGFVLHVPDVLRAFIEQNVDSFRKYLWPFIRASGCDMLIYCNIPETTTSTPIKL